MMMNPSLVSPSDRPWDRPRDRLRTGCLLAAATFLVACAGEPTPTAERAHDTVREPAPQDLPTEIVKVDERGAQANGAARQIEEVVVTGSAMYDIAMPQRMAEPAMGYAPQLALLPPSSEAYPDYAVAGVQRVADTPVSTFSMDVDTAAYANVRRHLEDGLLPPTDAVRVEELVNYFDYGHRAAAAGDGFALTTELAASPLRDGHQLLMIGLRTEDAPRAAGEQPRSLVLLVDTSGSMRSPDKLPLLKRALALLVRQLGADDRVSLVTYAGSAGIALEPTPGNQQGRILAAIEQLGAGGGTHGSAGIRTAYDLAREQFVDGGVNRVFLATDGDFNVGTTDLDALERMISTERRSGIGLTVLGFGTGNYDDATAQRLAQNGDGIAAYIDGMAEARRVLVDQLDAQLHTVGRDARIQVEFNPARVSEYRLIGYETRAMAREDFEDDSVDAGDIGAGHEVTALYEIALVDSDARRIPELRYGQPEADARAQAERSDELAHVRVRWLAPRDGARNEGGRIERAIAANGDERPISEASEALRFATAVAGFGEHLRGGRHAGAFDLAAIADLAETARGEDLGGERAEFLQLVRLARALGGDAVAAR